LRFAARVLFGVDDDFATLPRFTALLRAAAGRAFTGVAGFGEGGFNTNSVRRVSPFDEPGAPDNIE
jgi:hypothetical protein